MSVWDSYRNRIEAGGGNKYNAAYQREKRFIAKKLPDNLSTEVVEIFLSEYGFDIESERMQKHKLTQTVSIENSDSLNEKVIYSLPDETIELGSLVILDGAHWLVYEKDYRSVVYTRARIIQCNHLLRWIENGTIYTQWCVIEDGTKLKLHSNSLVYWKR